MTWTLRILVSEWRTSVRLFVGLAVMLATTSAVASMCSPTSPLPTQPDSYGQAASFTGSWGSADAYDGIFWRQPCGADQTSYYYVRLTPTQGVPFVCDTDFALTIGVDTYNVTLLQDPGRAFGSPGFCGALNAPTTFLLWAGAARPATLKWTGLSSSSSAFLPAFGFGTTHTSLIGGPNPSNAGYPMTFVVDVTRESASPGGTVSIVRYPSDVQNAHIGCDDLFTYDTGDSRGAMCLISPATSLQVIARYSGDITNLPSSSAPFLQQVLHDTGNATTTSLTSSVNPSEPGAQVVLTAVVSATAGASAPTGTVRFLVDGTPIKGCDVVALITSGSGSSANCATNMLPIGLHYITAIYPGDSSNRHSEATRVQTVDAPSNTPPVPLYRFNTGTYHFYTDSEAEKGYVLQRYPNWEFEGIAAHVFAVEVIHTAPVYRFNAGTYHFYTIDPAERDYVVATFPSWSQEGVAFFTFASSQPGALPVYRFNTGGAHFYTMSVAERDYVLQNVPSWQLEGIAWYAYP
jgi:hypothetical protein